MKAEEFRNWIGRAFQPPEAEHVVGWCKECDQEVWIATDCRPFGMAESCEEHRPLSDLASKSGGSE